AGPVAVRPDRQRQGIGRALVEAALEAARRLGAPGCVLVGDPAFYGRFGFAARLGLTHEGVPDPFVMGVSLGAPVPEGAIQFHPAFAAE
ncbi:MAG: GNAT family N-acetyltransferase, partial [Alphaproteobacteria bacterium]|nr:GNAT family N-acetyltransferase [Alphaproteobacteria bacterium]